MQAKRVAISSFTAVLALVSAGSLPATASALPSGKQPTGVITRAQWESALQGDVSPDLCAYSCGGSWGAYEHAETDAFERGHYSEITVACYDVNPPARAGEVQWECGGGGKYGGRWYSWYVDLGPYGSAIYQSYPH